MRYIFCTSHLIHWNVFIFIESRPSFLSFFGALSVPFGLSIVPLWDTLLNGMAAVWVEPLKWCWRDKIFLMRFKSSTALLPNIAHHNRISWTIYLYAVCIYINIYATSWNAYLFIVLLSFLLIHVPSFFLILFELSCFHFIIDVTRDRDFAVKALQIQYYF